MGMTSDSEKGVVRIVSCLHEPSVLFTWGQTGHLRSVLPENGRILVDHQGEEPSFFLLNQ